MKRLIVNTPSGKQEVIKIEESGGYFDKSRVVWDESIDPAIDLSAVGKIKRNLDGTFDLNDAVTKSAHDSAVSDEQAKQQIILDRKNIIKTARTASTLPELKAVVQSLVEHLGLD